MWSRAVIKEKARERVRANYWPMVLAAIVMAISLGARSGISSSYRQWSENIENICDIESDIESDIEYAISDVMDVSFDESQMATIIFFVLLIIVLCAISLALTALVFNPLHVGAVRYFFRNINKNAELGELGYGFKKNWSNIVGIMFVRILFIFLWSLLLIVPGIIKAYEYRMVPYLLANDVRGGVRWHPLLWEERDVLTVCCG